VLDRLNRSFFRSTEIDSEVGCHPFLLRILTDNGQSLIFHCPSFLFDVLHGIPPPASRFLFWISVFFAVQILIPFSPFPRARCPVLLGVDLRKDEKSFRSRVIFHFNSFFYLFCFYSTHCLAFHPFYTGSI